MRLSRCLSIGIDPNFVLDDPSIARKKITMFFEMTSDDFFRGSAH